jgi:hypothetical protein
VGFLEITKMEDGTQRPGRSLIDKIFNCLTTLIFIVILLVGGLFAAIYYNPHLPFNPFPPPTERPGISPHPPTITPDVTFPALWTETSAPTPTITPTLTPTNTPPVVSPVPTPLPYSLLPDTPFFTQNFLNDRGCAWMGVAGQVLAGEGEGALDVWVKLGGQLEGNPIDLTSLPGSVPGYGEGGYEFMLGDKPVASENLLWIQLVNTAEQPMSQKVYLTTSDSCQENLLIVSWVKSQ